ncbi:MAG: hypothetical protein WCQ99_11350 [Pseudomonadota bacterium]
MDKKQDDKILDKVKEALYINPKTKDSAPEILVEILYEYLSANISTHFEKTVEGIDTLHSSLLARQAEHAEISSRLKSLEDQMKRIEARLEKI